MGQQQTVAGGALRRMILALAIAALMVVMLLAMAAPAFANQGQGLPHGGSYQNNQNGSGHANSPINDTGGDDKNVNYHGKAYGDGNN